MKDHPIFTVLIFLILTSFNLGAEAFKGTLRSYLRHSALARQLSGGEKTNDLMNKFYERRAAGILPQPRVGRTMNVVRPDGAAGLVQYPRVGRSGMVDVLDRNYAGELDSDQTVENHPESFLDLDYQVNFDENSRRRIENNGLWLGVQPKYSNRKDQQHRPNHCDNQIDGAWAFLLSPPRDYQKMDQQSSLKFTPKISSNSENSR